MRAGGKLTPGALRQLLRVAVDGFGVSLCLHRMLPKTRATDWQTGLNMPPAELDRLIELLVWSQPGRTDRWLSVTFDDGYADSAEYIRSRAPNFPEVEFTFFVCPGKLEARSGFRWDLAEEAMKQGASREEAVRLTEATVDGATENERAELKDLAKRMEYPLATVEETQALLRFENVRLGNHTNLHLSANRLADAVVQGDYATSKAQFERLFGEMKTFAFPYGTPVHHFSSKHVEMLRALGQFEIWTTEARPYRVEERKPGAVLPRFPVNGSRSAMELAGWIAARSMDFRVRGKKRA